MPLTLHVIRASEFVRLDAEEHLDFEASKNALQGLALACRKRGLDRAMLDLRKVPVPDKPLFTASELAALVGAFRDAGFSRRQRLAILYAQDVHGGIRNFTFFSRLRGLQVQAFHDFETALLWVSEETELPAELQHGTPVPIMQRETAKRPAKLAVAFSSATTHRPARRAAK